MRFTPKSETELSMTKLLKPGIYDFYVEYAEEAVSKKGNEMIKVTLNTWDQEGKQYVLYDYLLEAMAYKLKHFAEATGLGEQYHNGQLSAEDCKGKI